MMTETLPLDIEGKKLLLSILKEKEISPKHGKELQNYLCRNKVISLIHISLDSYSKEPEQSYQFNPYLSRKLQEGAVIGDPLSEIR